MPNVQNKTLHRTTAQGAIRSNHHPPDANPPSLPNEEYETIRQGAPFAREGSPNISESVLQHAWHAQVFSGTPMRTDGGQRIRIIAPGWWNRSEGPDFRDAQIEFDDELLTGDVEIHVNHAAWFQHGHNTDRRYNNVLLACALEFGPPRRSLSDASGRVVPTLSLLPHLSEDIHSIAKRLSEDESPRLEHTTSGQCSPCARPAAIETLIRLTALAGEWRMRSKAHQIEEAIRRSGTNQAIYESFLAACGYLKFKQQFHSIARHLPYDRVRQLALQDPFLLEAAMFQIAGLLPQSLDLEHADAHHWMRLQTLRKHTLAGMKALPIKWDRSGVRPNNSPERRMAGATRFLARTAKLGLDATLEAIWHDDSAPAARRIAFEVLFPNPTGFWASHHTWTGRPTAKPCAMLGKGRIRSIIGNVFIPAALALARINRNRPLEERVLDFFRRFPKEPGNRIVGDMAGRLFGLGAKPRLTFRMQQGILQIHHDWCETNPSCQNCTLLQFLDSGP